MEMALATIDLLSDFQRHHWEMEISLDQQRIAGLTAFVVGMAVLTKFYLDQPRSSSVDWAYRGLVGMATVLVLVFQSHWSYYVFEHREWAKKYFNELEEQLMRADFFEDQPGGFRTPFTTDAQLQGSCPVFKGSIYGVELKERQQCWRTRKQLEIRNEWCDGRGLAHTWRWKRCADTHITSARIMLSPRQINVWNICILAFSAFAFLFSWRKNHAF